MSLAKANLLKYFVFKEIEEVDKEPTIEVHIEAKVNSRAKINRW